MNPGEPGMIYLKAYEKKRSHPISAELREYSNEWVGWSDEPSQLFLANSTFFIDEGNDVGNQAKLFPAKFEVWFVPDSGGKERKLLEKVFQIQGWNR